MLHMRASSGSTAGSAAPYTEIEAWIVPQQASETYGSLLFARRPQYSSMIFVGSLILLLSRPGCPLRAESSRQARHDARNRPCSPQSHIDATIIAERPKLAPYIPEMRQCLSKATGVAMERISVKATTTEGLGFAGRAEGIAAHAVVLVKRLKS